MCGIVGILSNNLTLREKVAFQEMLFMSTLRGVDSTGVFGVSTKEHGKDKKFSYGYVKKAVSAPEFLSDENTMGACKEKVFDPSGHWVKALVGHTRAATIGSVSQKNAHPFKYNHILGIHNGTLRTKLTGHMLIDTDSECLYRNIAEKGAVETLSQLGGYTDAFALVWFDSSNRSINLIRNTQRPLHFAYSTTKREFLFASEKEFISLAASRNNIKIDDIHMLKEYSLTQFFVNKDDYVNNCKSTDLTEMLKPKTHTVYHGGKSRVQYSSYGRVGEFESGYVEEPPKRPKPVVVDLTINRNPTKESNDNKASGADLVPWYKKELIKDTPKTEPKTPTKTHSHHPTGPAIPNRPTRINTASKKFYEGFRGVQIERDVMKRVLNNGCLLCGVVPYIHDNVSSDINFLDTVTFVCDPCSSANWVQDELKEAAS